MKDYLIFAKYRFLWHRKEFYTVVIVNIIVGVINHLTSLPLGLSFSISLGALLFTIIWFKPGLVISGTVNLSGQQLQGGFSWKYFTSISATIGRKKAILSLIVSTLFFLIPMDIYIIANFSTFISFSRQILIENVYWTGWLGMTETPFIIFLILLVNWISVLIEVFGIIKTNIVVLRRSHQIVERMNKIYFNLKYIIQFLFWGLNSLMILLILESCSKLALSYLSEFHRNIVVLFVLLSLMMFLFLFLFKRLLLLWEKEERSYFDYSIKIKKDLVGVIFGVVSSVIVVPTYFISIEKLSELVVKHPLAVHVDKKNVKADKFDNEGLFKHFILKENIEGLQQLKKSGFKFSNKTKIEGTDINPLVFAIVSKKYKSVKFLLAKGFDPNCEYIRKNNDRVSMLLLATTIKHCSPKVVEELLKSGAIAFQEHHSLGSPMEQAIKNNCLASAIILQKAGAPIKIHGKRKIASYEKDIIEYLEYKKKQKP